MAQVGDDCYFFYYSSCSKGPSCPFRHVEAALGSEVMCTHWQAGTCNRPGCRFRHFEIKVDRSNTPCYWESQPSGCTKPHCVFKHFKKQPDIDILPTIDEVPPRVGKNVYKTRNNEMEVAGIRAAQQEVDRASPRIEPVVVNPFEDDSDADSVTGTPQKKAPVIRKTVPPKQEKMNTIVPTGAALPRKTVVGLTTTKRKIKMLEPEPSEQVGVTPSVSDSVMFTESSSRRNVVISDEGDSDTGKSFQDLIKKSKSSLGLVAAPSDQTGVKFNVKNRLGHTEGVAKLSPSKSNVKTRLGLDTKSDRVSPVTVSIKDRLGAGLEDSTSRADVKSRLGAGSEDSTSRTDVKSRLGAGSEDSTSRTDVKSRLGGSTTGSNLGLKSLADLRAQKLAIKKQLEEDSGEDDDGEDVDDVPNIKIKSLEEIRAEKAKKAKLAEKTANTRKGWKTSVKAVVPPVKSAPKRKIITYTELFEEEPARADNSVEDEPAVKVKSLEDIRKERAAAAAPVRKERAAAAPVRKSAAPKKERQIYQPPARKTEEQTNKNLTKNVPAKRTITAPQAEEESTKVAKVKPVADVRVKTFSEIMAEKRKRALELKAQQEEKKLTDSNPNRPKVRITPIVFDADETDKKEAAPVKSSVVTVKQTVSVAPLRNKNTQLKENVSVSEESVTEQRTSVDNRLSEAHVLSDSNGCADHTKSIDRSTSREDHTKSVERSTSREEQTNKPPSVESEAASVISPSKRRSSSQSSDLIAKKKSRQSLNLTEDDDDFFFGTDLDDVDDGGKIDEGDLLQDIDELLA